MTVITIKCRQLVNKEVPVAPNTTSININSSSNLCPAITAQNIDLINSLWWLQDNLWKIIEDASEVVLKNELQVPLDVNFV